MDSLKRSYSDPCWKLESSFVSKIRQKISDLLVENKATYKSILSQVQEQELLGVIRIDKYQNAIEIPPILNILINLKYC